MYILFAFNWLVWLVCCSHGTLIINKLHHFACPGHASQWVCPSRQNLSNKYWFVVDDVRKWPKVQFISHWSLSTYGYNHEKSQLNSNRRWNLNYQLLFNFNLRVCLYNIMCIGNKLALSSNQTVLDCQCWLNKVQFFLVDRIWNSLGSSQSNCTVYNIFHNVRTHPPFHPLIVRTSFIICYSSI